MKAQLLQDPVFRGSLRVAAVTVIFVMLSWLTGESIWAPLGVGIGFIVGFNDGARLNKESRD